jgi:tRNA G18 (ribose-2'-O)-methylase SpoU
MRTKLTFEEIQFYQNQQSKNKITFPICALLEDIRSLYNVGSMFRTADGAGLESLFLTGYTGYPPRKEIEKTALGSTETVNWQRFKNPVECAEYLKSKEYYLLACEHTTDSKNYTEIQYPKNTCLMFGNEVDGLSNELCQIADDSILIPMYGAKQSLNVSVAFGIVVYNAVESYKKNTG